MQAPTATERQALLDNALRGQLSEAEARELAELDSQLLALALLAASRVIAERDVCIAELQRGSAPSLSTPSGQVVKYAQYVFTFLDYEHVPFENNFAERQIRPAVILRKNSQSNRSDRGAATQAVMMSVFRTLRLRDLDPTRTLVDALQAYVTTGQLPPLPGAAVADG